MRFASPGCSFLASGYPAVFSYTRRLRTARRAWQLVRHELTSCWRPVLDTIRYLEALNPFAPMFGGKDKSLDKTSSSNAMGSAGVNTLVKDTQVEGKIKAPSDLRIEGSLIGELDCQAKLIIGLSGKVSGQVRCRNARIEGHFDGTLEVSELLEVCDAASVTGEISCGKLKIDAGAHLAGNVRMSNSSQPVEKTGSSSVQKKEPALA